MAKLTMKPSFPGPGIFIATSNGITILTRFSFSSPSISMGGFARYQSLKVKNLACGFCFICLMRAHKRGHSMSITNWNPLVRAWALIRVQYKFRRSFTGGGFSALPNCYPSRSGADFPKKEVENLRVHMLTGLAIREQDTSDMAAMAFDRMLFEGHPYSRPSDGFVETVQSITRKDMQEFHRRYFGPKGMVIAIVGAIKPRLVEYIGGAYRVDTSADLLQPSK
jgi:zinc protease